MAPKRKAGRPSHGLSESRIELSGPALLFGAARVSAEREGVTLSEWLRRAVRVRLGWHVVLDDSPPSADTETR